MGAKLTGAKELQDDLQQAADDAVKGAKGVVAKGSLNIKKDTQRAWSGFKHAPALPRAVGYDTKVSGTLVSSEIGPDKAKRQGALGNLLEYGSVNNAPHPALNPALDAEDPRFTSALEDLGIDLLEGRAVRSDGPGDSG
jgi:hypothetical protein